MNNTIHTDAGVFSFFSGKMPVLNQRQIQFIIAMKMFLILLAISLRVSAAAYSQDITLSLKKAPLRDVMKSIRQQTGYQFLFKSSYLKDARPVTIELQNSSIEESLEKIFADQPFSYSKENKIIIIQPKSDKKKDDKFTPESKLDEEKQIIIKGKVTDNENKPLIGVNIRIKDSQTGTTTNEDGDYSITAESNSVLQFSYVGYTNEDIPIKGRTVINIILKELLNQLDEAVIKGYYSTTKILNTGSVSTLKAEEISKQPVSDPLLALQGKIPGLYLFQTSGVPGAGLQVRLRGQNSIANGNDPFYIVDGVPFNASNLSQNTNATLTNLSPFMSLRPEDIESIDVLKDADATAIYGSRGANGVILITTKKGKSGQTRLDVNVSNGIGEVAKKIKAMNTPQYLEMRKEAYLNDGLSIPTSTTTVSSSNADLTLYDQNKYTDWQEKFIGGTANFLNAQGSISGGNKNTQFLLSGSYRKETTVYPGPYNNRIGSMLVNINHTSENEKFHADFSSSYSNSNNRLPIIDLTKYILIAPNSPDPYNADGTINWLKNFYSNPYAWIEEKLTAKTENLISNITLSYNIINGLQLKSNFGYTKMRLDESTIQPATSIMPRSGILPTNRLNDLAHNSVGSWIIDPQINYRRVFGKNTLEALVGATWQQKEQEGVQQRYVGFSSDDLIENISAASALNGSSSIYSLYHYNAIYGRIGYNYDEKYVLNLTGRRDGSSRFGPDRQFGNFGAIGAAWIFSKENFLRLPSFISYGKLRGSIGKTGNDQIDDYEYLSSYLSNGTTYMGVSTLDPKSLTNPLYGWETINKIEAALETGFLDNKLLFNIDWYRNRTGNQLVGYNLPGITGFSNVRANLPAVIENKGLEIEITSQNLSHSGFSWSTSGNISVPKNKLISYPNLTSSSYAQRYVVGQPLFIMFLYKSTGVDKNTGLYTFDDLNKDGEITSSSDIAPYFVGQKWFGAITNNFTYNGFTLDFSIQFVKQTGYDYTIQNGTPGRYNVNQPTYVLNRWEKAGEEGSQFQKYTTFISNENSLYTQSDALITDASFIRLKNIYFAWEIPERWSQKACAKHIKVYLQGQNLVTFTKFKGLDPETQGVASALTLPSLRIITAGLNLTF
ncbi:SusC/RagA family TonB-linked outer membrane protein [Chitinophaga sp. MM2321]|uniref:SusC/RagA family TonB-linked outer membrane protein n=1 Tax=Chitinophaga sp. MM2321 TaxID=3137178 RepID=UPI0032D5A8C5